MAFPSTSVLDNFTGTNGTDLPVYSSNWQTAPTGGVNLEIQSNAATGTAAASNNTNSWATSYGPDCEVYVTITTKPADGNILLLLARGVQETSLATADGYCLRFAPVAGTDTITIQRIDNGAQTSISSAFSQEVSNGDSIGLEIIGNTLTAYYKPSGGAWTSLGSTTDSTYTTAGKIGLLTSSTTIRLDDFGGGTYVAPGVTGTVAVTTGDDTSSASGSTTVQGSVNLTTGDDTSTASGSPVVSGTVSVTTADDTSNASGSVGAAVDGTASITTADDTSSASGTTTVQGTSAVTTADDVSNASGTTIVVGTSNVTTADDTSSANGTTIVTGSVSVTTADDTSSASGSVGGGVDGSANITTQDDTSSATGTTTILGVASDVTGDDTSTASGSTTVVGFASVTTNDDTSTASGNAGAITGTVEVTTGNDIASAFGTTPQENLFGGVAHFAKLSERSRKLRELEAQERTEAPASEDIAEVIQIPQEVREIISNVAKIDNEKKQRAQLKAQLKALEIQFKQEYADALKTEMIRQYLIMELEQQEEEEAIAMLMMALV